MSTVKRILEVKFIIQASVNSYDQLLKLSKVKKLKRNKKCKKQQANK